MTSQRVPRFHIDGTLAVGMTVSLSKEASRHLAGVLRARVGDRVGIFNGDGKNYVSTVVALERNIQLRVDSAVVNACESVLAITLVQALSRGDRMDATIRQSVELGAAHIVPVVSRRSVAKLDEARARKRHAHWSSIVVSASEQCGRSVVPALDPITPLDTWLSELALPLENHFVLVPDATAALGGTPMKNATATVLIGPESGLDPVEIAAAQDAGFEAAHLGPRVLRTETAGPAALSVLQARHGDL